MILFWLRLHLPDTGVPLRGTLIQVSYQFSGSVNPADVGVEIVSGSDVKLVSFKLVAVVIGALSVEVVAVVTVAGVSAAAATPSKGVSGTSAIALN
jgi:hypothetical protein